MASILGIQTVDGLQVISVDVNPSFGVGTVSPIGSIALASDGSGMFAKTGALNTDWVKIPNLINVNDLIVSQIALMRLG